MERGSTGQMRSSNPPRQPAGHYGKRPNWANALEQPPASLRGGLRQGLQISVRSLASRKGALCPTCGFQNVLFREAAPAECAFSLCPTCRMRFSVECAFPHLGKRRAASRKSAFCHLRLTEKRILYPVTHGKPHSAIPRSRRLRLSVTRRLQNAPFRDVAAPGRCGATARQAAGHYGKRPNWANALEQPPASLRGGLCQVAETGTTTSVTAPVRRAPLHARSNRAGSFKLPLRESRLRRGKCLFP